MKESCDNACVWINSELYLSNILTSQVSVLSYINCKEFYDIF